MHRATSPTATADTHERVRQAALDLFTLHGYQSTSLRDLAAYLGMQPGSLYNHIENKQSLLFDLIEEALDALLTDTRARIRQGRTRDERLRLFVQASLDFQKRECKPLALINREMVNLSAEQREQVKGRVDEYARCLKSVIAGQPATATATPTATNSRLDLLIGAIIGMLQGLHPWGADVVDASRDADQLTRMISGAIGAASA